MLFQKNIVKKYLAALPEETVNEAWHTYRQYFLNHEIQQNILQSKEEQFQEGFLRELFVKVLGYTLNPSPGYNLITEQKNETNSKKADGAIIVDGQVVGVIELKDHKTPDLTRVEAQAFGYKSQHVGTRIVIISNFEKLRLYIDNAVDCREWNLFTLSRQDFAELYLCLAWSQVSTGVAIQMKSESVSSEDQITNALYRDYSEFKRVLFADILKNNPRPVKGSEGSEDSEGSEYSEYSENSWRLLLFKKTQKLLDRLLFIFFAEDCGLLPPNSMVQIIDQWQQLKDIDEYRPFYDRVKKYFGYMNTGFKGKKYEIFAYNGGLFKPDAVLDNIKITDDLLAEHARRLSEYDFESDVDVNILGHIFENSLSEIEEVTQQITNGDAPQTSKRKQDGVFYTPQYVTKYIVDNTVGRLCTEKKRQLGIDEAEYFSDQRRQLQTKRRLLDQLTAYRDWLLQITILDPACGSGAFLNAALQFLMAEHKLIDEMEAKVTGSAIEFQGVENSILENNLFGVDINDESVEIAQLALWLRTAKPYRKLNTLSANIKCGNSLISDPSIAGAKAFDWQQEFPQVFEKGGFDVVIGNPPYVHLESVKETSEQLSEAGYATYNKRGDMYCIFVEKAFRLVKPDGMVSYIMPNKWMQAGYGKELRQFMLGQRLEQLIDFGDIQIFEGATTYPCIFVARNSSPASTLTVSVLTAANSQDFNQNVLSTAEIFDYSQFSSDTWVISSQKDKALLESLSRRHKKLKDFIGGEAYRGVLTGLSEAFLIDAATYQHIVGQDEGAKEHIRPFLQGRHITPYGKAEAVSYLILFEKGWTQSEFGTEDETEAWNRLADRYPSIAQWLEPFAEKGRKRTDKGDFWWELRACDYYEQFAKPKIMYQAFQVKPCFIFDNEGFYSNNSMWFIPTESKALLAVLNSKMGWWLITKSCSQIQNGYQLIWKYFGQIVIPALDGSSSLETLADAMLTLHSDLQQKRSRFLRRLTDNFEGVKITTALQTFDQMEFKTFVAELKKQKVKLSLVQQDEWEDYFTQHKAACCETSDKIAATDSEIDLMVYRLYGLTYDEVLTVDPTTKIKREDYDQ